MTHLIDDSRVMLQILASLTDYSRGIIYNCNMFIVQATGAQFSDGTPLWLAWPFKQVLD